MTIFSVCVLLIIGIILIISFVYYFVHKRIFTDIRRRWIHWRMTRDDEFAINGGQSQETISLNQQIRNDIRQKYQLK
jgi:hypothetical protein